MYNIHKGTGAGTLRTLTIRQVVEIIADIC
jgi:hypothetical protein